MRILLAVPLLFSLAACTNDGETAPMQGVNRTIDVSRNTDGSYKATAPACPKWNDETLSRYANDPMPQLGCATAGNLAKMIADPADLVRDKTKGDKQITGDGEALSHGVQSYRQGKASTSTTTTSTSTSGASAGAATE